MAKKTVTHVARDYDRVRKVTENENIALAYCKNYTDESEIYRFIGEVVATTNFTFRKINGTPGNVDNVAFKVEE
jgi:hypothetical protein